MEETWQSDESGGVSVEDLDNAIKNMNELDLVREAKKKDYSEANEAYESARFEVLSILKAAGKSKYFVDGLGTAYIINRATFKTPKDLNQKEEFFNYVTQKHGVDVVRSLITVNHQTLNAFCKKELEAAIETGNAVFQIPGVGEPTVEQTIGFRKG